MAERRKDTKKKVLKEGEYERQNGTYEYKWRDRQGRRHSVYAKTWDELRDKELSVLRDILDGIDTEGKKTKLDDLFERWISLKRKLKKSTENKYRHDYHKYISPTLGNMPIAEIKTSDILAFYNQLSDTLHFTVGTIATIHRILHQVLNFAVEDDLIRKDPSKKALANFKNEHLSCKPDRKAMTLAEQDLFVEFLKTSRKYNRWEPIFIVMLWTGLRAGEVTGLQWSDIDFANNTIHVTHQLIYLGDEKLTNNHSVMTSPKTANSIRDIQMLPVVRGALLREKEIQKLTGLKCKVEIDSFSDFVFLTRNGRPKHGWGLNDALRNIVAECNREVMAQWTEEFALTQEDTHPVLLPDLSCHWLRHTFATRCVEANINPKCLQSLLGHSEFETTMDIYADAPEDLQESEIIKIQQFFGDHKERTS